MFDLLLILKKYYVLKNIYQIIYNTFCFANGLFIHVSVPIGSDNCCLYFSISVYVN